MSEYQYYEFRAIDRPLDEEEIDELGELSTRAEIRANRVALNQVRQLPDSEVRRLQVRGSARLTAFVRGQLGSHS